MYCCMSLNDPNDKLQCAQVVPGGRKFEHTAWAYVSEHKYPVRRTEYAVLATLTDSGTYTVSTF